MLLCKIRVYRDIRDIKWYDGWHKVHPYCGSPSVNIMYVCMYLHTYVRNTMYVHMGTELLYCVKSSFS